MSRNKSIKARRAYEQRILPRVKPAMARVAIFARVSKDKQSNDRQIADLKQFGRGKDYDITHVITEKISGDKANSKRRGLTQLLEAADRKEFDKVLVAEVTRLGRDTAEVLQALKYLHARGISVVVQNFNIETLNPDGTLNSIAQFIFTMLADIGRMEKATLIERINSGLRDAKRKGRRLGRKPGSVKTSAKILKEYPRVAHLLKAGLSVREVCGATSHAQGTVMRVRKILFAVD